MKTLFSLRVPFFLLLVCFFGLEPVMAQEDCSKGKCQPSPFDCEFYQCFKERKCCPNGYNEKIGSPYCQKFLGWEKEKFTPRGQEFLQQTRLCLQKKAAEIPEDLNCQQFKKQALDDHSTCYTQGKVDICSLPLSDQMQLLKGIGSRALTPSFARESIETFQFCAKKFWDQHGLPPKKDC